MLSLGLVAELSFAPVDFKAAVAFRALVGLQSHRVIDQDREQLTAVGAVDFSLTCDRPGEADLVHQEVVKEVHGVSLSVTITSHSFPRLVTAVS